MSVIIDPYKSYAQKYYNNDSIVIPLTLRNLSYVPVKPLDNAILTSASFKFTGLNPNISESTVSEQIILQVDTNRNFNSPALQTFASNSVTGITTSFNVTLPVQNPNTLYFTRTNAVINQDSSGWSEIRSLIYDPVVSDNKDQLSDSTYTVFTLKPEQYNGSNLINVNYSNDTGFTLNHYTGDLYVKSYGSNANEASYFIINQLSYYSDGGGNTGYNFAKVRKYNGQIKDIRNFRMNSSTSSDSLLTFLNTYDSTEYIMGYYAAYVPGLDSIRQDVKNKLKEFGSVYADSLTIEFFEDNFNTWAFIGSLGADPEDNCEKFHRFRNTSSQMPLDCQIEPSFQNSVGSVAAIFGPSDNWKSFSWDRILFPASDIKVNVYGVNSENNYNLLYEGLTSNNLVNIDTLNSFIYPNIRLEAVGEIDSSKGTQSPVFQAFRVNYVPPAELLPDNNSFTGTDTTVLEGDSVSFSVNYYNVGYIDAPVVINKWYAVFGQTQRVISLDTVNSPLMVDSMMTSYIKFSTAGLRDPKLTSDTIDLFFETSIADNRNELFTYNNTAITRFIIQGDTADPVMDVTYDGLKILNGDFIQANPVINLQFYDNSRMVINDTSNVKIYRYVNNGFQYVPYYINGEKNPVIDISLPDNNFLQATVIYQYHPKNLEAGVQEVQICSKGI
ncbi:MAG: interleukin-like EMT inducer domain-containing protein [Ignavibacteria bacterium]